MPVRKATAPKPMYTPYAPPRVDTNTLRGLYAASYPNQGPTYAGGYRGEPASAGGYQPKPTFAEFTSPTPNYVPPALTAGQTDLGQGLILNAPIVDNQPAPNTGLLPGRSGQGGLDPAIAAELAKQEAIRRLRLEQLKGNVNLDLNSLGTTRDTSKKQMGEQYNRQSASTATPYLARGLATSGVANTGIARFHQDYASSVANLETTYAQQRARLLKQIADAEAETSLGSSLDALSAGSNNYQSILDLVAKYS